MRPTQLTKFSQSNPSMISQRLGLSTCLRATPLQNSMISHIYETEAFQKLAAKFPQKVILMHQAQIKDFVDHQPTTQFLEAQHLKANRAKVFQVDALLKPVSITHEEHQLLKNLAVVAHQLTPHMNRALAIVPNFAAHQHFAQAFHYNTNQQLPETVELIESSEIQNNHVILDLTEDQALLEQHLFDETLKSSPAQTYQEFLNCLMHEKNESLVVDMDSIMTLQTVGATLLSMIYEQLSQHLPIGLTQHQDIQEQRLLRQEFQKTLFINAFEFKGNSPGLIEPNALAIDYPSGLQSPGLHGEYKGAHQLMYDDLGIPLVYTEQPMTIDIAHFLIQDVFETENVFLMTDLLASSTFQKPEREIYQLLNEMNFYLKHFLTQFCRHQQLQVLNDFALQTQKLAAFFYEKGRFSAQEMNQFLYLKSLYVSNRVFELLNKHILTNPLPQVIQQSSYANQLIKQTLLQLNDQPMHQASVEKIVDRMSFNIIYNSKGQ